jgi:6-phosphogluconolactonase (cycloisomerase 2 family)
MRSPRGAVVAIVLALIQTLALSHRAGADGLFFLESHRFWTFGGDLFDGTAGVAVSPDGAHVYVVGSGADQPDNIVVLARDPSSGSLVLVETHQSEGDDPWGAQGVAVSPDGAHVYVASTFTDTLTVFSRDPSTGRLSFVQVVDDDDAGIDGLAGARAVALSPDGLHLYAAASGDDAITVFRRDPATGVLAFIETHEDEVGGVTSLEGARGLAVSPDGAHVYAAASVDSAITGFRRNPATGRLSLGEVLRDEVAGASTLDGARAVALSPDGLHLYAAASRDDALTVFRRDPSTGALAFVEAHEDEIGDVNGLNGAQAVAVSPDGEHVYVAAEVDKALAVFHRDSASGALTFVEREHEGSDGVAGLDGVRAVAVGAAGQVYTASAERDGSLAVFDISPCRDGAVGPGEQCDSGDAHGPNCCSSTCQFKPNGTVCRSQAGACDVAETCTGSSGSCPSDLFLPASVTCRAAEDTCDVAETCTGAGASCPPDAFVGSTTICRLAAGPCDLAETCTGYSARCPSDEFFAASVTCRAAEGACDVAETCTGAVVSCPPDAFAGSTTICRLAAGPCDLAETCTGSSAGCPSNEFVTAGVTCRTAADVCDVPEKCSGETASCGPDRVASPETTCRTAAGFCDVQENCTGSGARCPADRKSTAVCRPAAGVCDVAEACDGASDSCPSEAFQPASFECRPATDGDDTPEFCTGADPACPPDTGPRDVDSDAIPDGLDNCPATADSTQDDSDGDGKGDACDPCSNVVPVFARKASVSVGKLGGPNGDEGLKFKGEIAVPPSPLIDPLENGIRIMLEDSAGVSILDGVIPGGFDPSTGAGWKVNTSRTRWQYKNRSGLQGIVKVKLTQRSSTPGTILFVVTAKNGHYAVSPTHIPVRGTVVIDSPVAMTGQCGEAVFPGAPGPRCTLNARGTTLACR